MKRVNLKQIEVKSFVTKVQVKGGIHAVAGESEFNTVCPFCPDVDEFA